MLVFGILIALGAAADVLLTGFSAVDLFAALSGLVLTASALPPAKRRLSSFRGINAVLAHAILAALAIAVLFAPLALTQGKGSQKAKSAVLNKSKTLCAQGKYDEAYNLLAAFEEEEKAPEVLQNMAAVEILRKNPRLAEELLSEANREKAMDATMHYNLGLCSFQKGNYLDAIASFQNAVRLAPDLWEAYYYEGEAYYRKENYRSAAYCFDQAIKIAPDHAEIYCRLAAVKLETMDYQRAQEFLDTVKTLDMSQSMTEQIAALEKSIAFYTEAASGSRI